MDSLAGTPICYSSMEAEELDDVSGQESAPHSESESEEGEGEDAAGAAASALRNQFIRPRFQSWLQDIAPTYDQGNLLREIFGHVTITARDVEVISSERNLLLDFEFYGMIGRYRQCSQADTTSPVWDVSKGDFDLKANVEAELVLDGESLVSSAHFAGTATSSGRSRCHINKERLAERFGTETAVKLGGSATLLQFLGVICCDPGASCYAEVLPFGLAAKLLAISEESDEDRTRSNRSPRATAKKAASPAKPLPPTAAAAANAGYPSAAAKKEVQAAAVPASTAAAQVKPSAPPTRPPASEQGPSRPRIGASKASAAPKVRQSSQGRKPAAPK